MVWVARFAANVGGVPGETITSTRIWTKSAASWGGSYIHGNLNDSTYPFFACLNNATTLIAGYRFSSPLAAGATPMACIAFLDGATHQLGVYYNSAQKLVVYRGGTGGTLLGTSATTISLGS